MRNNPANNLSSSEGSGSGRQSGSGASPSRRKFLRQFGIAGAATAAFVGMADMAGLEAARGAVKSSKPQAANRPKSAKQVRTLAEPDTANCSNVLGEAFCSPGKCGKACPSGYWCNYTWNVGAACGARSGYRCVKGGCDYYSHSTVICCASIA